MWFIPTHVGNMIEMEQEQGALLVHPHLCGEYLYDKFAGFVEIGSSPLMWGIHTNIYPVLTYDRFIPTHVGNTC